ncbi:SusC/RagA family TonB-linked outer membrane protein [Sphingobacterium sp. SRCM116780]|uniref:SusC/RagA family TonB-linked outer membrane protein n=1 Tax=Sphingobacterium sp. SRCM116780 TaxID=2907623 RepID=UPI001F29ACA0|nr:SusC/RagA family TonB-linked outer membrane protein [Sphingobacterium sp. SRCM116780]UIR54633.1 SusC/RagA family TonB-linked outer membrane protein [Sphingobacterium sp. SRCM116780]
MKKRSVVFLAANLLLSTAIYAQTVLKGRVVDKEGKPIPGVSITLKDGTGTQTGSNGEFSISYKQQGPLSISAIGYERKQVAISNQTTIEVTLASNDETLDEVVVTAMGITREKKSLGYAVQDVKAKELTSAGQLNLTNSLSGKVAGVQVNQFGGAVGASARIAIRGNSSLLAEQQPLIVIDGVPISNRTQRSGDNTYNGVDYGSGLNDINPEDIESVTVLKGGSAALYGMRAGKGVIMITTKSGKRASDGVVLSYDGNFTVDQAATIPKYQDLYGQGNRGDEYHYGLLGNGLSYQDYAQQKSFTYVDGAGAGVNDNFDESWGPRLDKGLLLPQFNSPVVNGVRQATPWISHPSNVKDFFQTGYSQNHNISLLAKGANSSTRASLSYRNQKGTVPNTDQKKYTAQVNNDYKINDKFSFDIMSNYTRTESDNLVSQGYDGANPMNGLIWFGRQVDMKDLKENWDQRDDQGNYTYYNWNSSYHMNPYFSMNKTLNSLNLNRIFGKSSLYYQPYEFLKFEGRVGIDHVDTKMFERNYFNYDHPLGSFREMKNRNTEFNLDFLTNFNKQFGDFNVVGTLGANYRDAQFESNTLGADGLTVLGVYTITNKVGDAVTAMDHSHSRSNSVYGQASVGWRDQLYVDVTARNDWSSTVNDAFFYPSLSLSWIPTTSFANLKSDILSYWKLRFNIAAVGNGTDPYRNQNYYYAQNNSYGGIAQMYKSMIYAIKDIQPERINTWEVGTEVGFFKDRLHADFTYYHKNAINQILSVATSNVVGFSNMVLNAGNIESKGVELQLRGDILKNENALNWTATINYSKDKSKILELYPELDLNVYQLGWTWGIANTATVGESWGALRGNAYDRVEDGPMKGAIKVNNSGFVESKPGEVIGHVVPDFLASLRNDFRYKDFSFGFMLDFRKGGDIWSQTMSHSYTTGVAEITAANGIRERAIVAGKDVMQNERYAMKQGNDWVENTIQVNAQDWFESGGISESYVFDGSFLKLREAYLTYTIPEHVYNRIKGIKRANVSLVGSNLALLWVDKSNTMRLDPETGGVSSDSRGMGFEQATVPSSRSIGLKLGFSF